MPTPSVPSGPGSIQAPSRGTGRIFAAVATMSPPSPITIESPSVASQSRVSRHMRCGSTGDSSESSAASTFFSSSTSILRSSSRQPLKSSFTPAFFISSSSSSKVQARLPTRPTLRGPVLPDQRRVHVELDDLRVGRDRLAEGEAEVEQRAGEDDQIDLLHRLAARAVQELRRGRRDRAAAHAVRVAGHVRLIEERVHRGARHRPLDAGAGHQHRALGVAQQLERLAHVGAIGRDARRRRCGSAAPSPAPTRSCP